jgi:membrane protease subunit (stomatin/prohibitin family)
MGIRSNIAREFIAVPDDVKGQILYKWPDQNIRKFARVIVDADEMALFVSRGEVVGVIEAGREPVPAAELPFIGNIIDWATDGNAFRAELYFVGTREYTGQTFGGRIDDVQDPQTGLIVTLRVFGEYSLKVFDPAKLVLNLTGTVDVTDNDKIGNWVDSQLLKTMRTAVTTKIVGNAWAILGLSAHLPELEEAVLAATNQQLENYGLLLARMGNFDVNLADEDAANLKDLATKTAGSRLAGSFGQYAAGEALLGAGEGMSKGGGAGTQSAFIGAGFGVAQTMAQAPGQPGPPIPPTPGFAGGGAGFVQEGAAGAGTCTAGCGVDVPAGAKFCPGCGAAQAPSKQFCISCGTEMPGGSKFCPSCGAAQAPAAADSPAPPAPPAPPAQTEAPTPPPEPPAPAAGEPTANE